MDELTQPLRWTGSALELLDQRRLPHELIYLSCSRWEDVRDAIRDMVVRGAPAIGVCAAYALVLPVSSSSTLQQMSDDFAQAASQLRQARPTAINLGWAIDRMSRKFEELKKLSGRSNRSDLSAMKEGLTFEAVSINREDLEGNRLIGRFGNELLGNSPTILTHCNAGALATSGYGTALGVIRAAHESGKKVAVFADETRPYLQGSRLTVWELQREGIDVTLITDSMAGHFFSRKTFDAVIVGADRIAANGDTANKIGTYTLAVLAKAHGVPFYVAAPLSTIDTACPDGRAIPIEERSASEVTELAGTDAAGIRHSVRIAPEGTAARHPAFDVTPAGLISAFITERGVLYPPFDRAIAAVLAEAENSRI